MNKLFYKDLKFTEKELKKIKFLEVTGENALGCENKNPVIEKRKTWHNGSFVVANVDASFEEPIYLNTVCKLDYKREKI